MATKEPHLVSKAVLKSFCDTDGLLVACSLRSRSASRGCRKIGRDGVGYVDDLHPGDPDAFEAFWRRIEDDLPAALEAAMSHTITSQPELQDLLRDCLAMHLARSWTLKALHAWLETTHLEQLRSVLLLPIPEVRTFLDLWYGARHNGMTLSAREIMADEFVERIRQLSSASPFVPGRFVERFLMAKAAIDARPIVVGTPGRGRFLIGDAPAQPYRRGHRGVGFRPPGGPSWSTAETFIMPIGPGHLLYLGALTGYQELDGDLVDYVNGVEVLTAQRHVMWHPESDFVVTLRAIREDPTAIRRIPAPPLPRTGTRGPARRRRRPPTGPSGTRASPDATTRR